MADPVIVMVPKFSGGVIVMAPYILGVIVMVQICQFPGPCDSDGPKKFPGCDSDGTLLLGGVIVMAPHFVGVIVMG